MNVRLKFYYLNSFLSLLLGIILYLVIRKDPILESYENLFPFFRMFREKVYLENIKTIPLYGFINNHLSDIFWAYSYSIILFLKSQSFIKVLFLSFLIACITEYLQLINLVFGTFDFYDILWEITSTILALSICSYFDRKYYQNTFNKSI